MIIWFGEGGALLLSQFDCGKIQRPHSKKKTVFFKEYGWLDLVAIGKGWLSSNMLSSDSLSKHDLKFTPVASNVSGS